MFKLVVPLFEEFDYVPDKIVLGHIEISDTSISQSFKVLIENNTYLYKLSIDKEVLTFDISELELKFKVDYNDTNMLYKIIISAKNIYDKYFKPNVIKNGDIDINHIYFNQEYNMTSPMTDIAKINRVSDSIIKDQFMNNIKVNVSYKNDNLYYKIVSDFDTQQSIHISQF